jgi:hypothetical protein
MSAPAALTGYTLTPNSPDPYTGLANTYVGWHFVQAELASCLQAASWLQNYQGWSYHLAADPDNSQLQRLSLTSMLGNVEGSMMVTMIVTDTQWFVCDRGYVTVLDDDDVTNNYEVAAYTLPDPPAPPTPPAPPAFGLPPSADITVIPVRVAPPAPPPPMFPPPNQ